MRALQVQRSPIDNPFTANICPHPKKRTSLLTKIKKAFEEFGWPSRVDCHIADLKLFANFFSTPKHAEQLEALNLVSCKIGDQMIDLLPKTNQLKELVLDSCMLTNHSAQPLQHYLSTFTTLKSFSLKNNSYSAVGIPFILKGLCFHCNL